MPDRGAQKVLFVGGVGRSGSTLVEKLLNELPTTFAVGETVHLWERGVAENERCGCGATFTTCPHWSEVGRLAFGGWDQIDLDEIIDLRWSVDRSRKLHRIADAHRTATPDAAQRRYLDHLRPVLLASAAASGGAEVLLDSSKHLSTAALLALEPALDVRVLHLVRDPRGVAHSWTKHVARPETDGAAMPTYRPSRSAGRWLTDNLGFELLAGKVPTLSLRYEDVLGDPVAALTAVARLLDIELSAADLGFLDGATAELSTPMHSVAGNPMRFGSNTVTLRLDDAWRTKAPLTQRALVTSVTAPMLWRYGYRLTPGFTPKPQPARCDS